MDVVDVVVFDEFLFVEYVVYDVTEDVLVVYHLNKIVYHYDDHSFLVYVEERTDSTVHMDGDEPFVSNGHLVYQSTYVVYEDHVHQIRFVTVQPQVDVVNY